MLVDPPLGYFLGTIGIVCILLGLYELRKSTNKQMYPLLSELHIVLLRRAAGTGQVRASTAEERDVLDDLVRRQLVGNGKLTKAGWGELRKADADLWRGLLARPLCPIAD